MLRKISFFSRLITIASIRINQKYESTPDVDGVDVHSTLRDEVEPLNIDLHGNDENAFHKLKYTDWGTYSQAEDSEVLPRFAIHESHRRHRENVEQRNGYVFGEGTPKLFIKSPFPRDDFEPTLEKHPSRVTREEDATLIILGPRLDCKTVKNFPSLPKLPEGKAYLIWVNSHKLCGLGQFNGREDVLFVSHDLRNYDLKNNNAKPLRGVSMAPAFFYGGETRDPSIPAKYFLTYRGQVRTGFGKSSSVRPDLQTAFSRFKARDDVVVEFLPKDTSHHYSQADKQRFLDLTNTSFFLNPHGDNRYMNGFATSLGSCAVPVIMADGLTMPFEEIIDWSKAAVFVPEKVAQEGAQAVIDKLPSDPDQIQIMRAEACRIHEEYFSTMERRIDALLKSAAIRITTP